MHLANAATFPDRVLQEIPPKGRPISQCQHCRAQRRAKHAHVKCDCGEKTAKCPHLKPTVEGHQSTCCCHHGAPCTCCHKKAAHRAEAALESDACKEADTKPAKPVRRRRSRTNTQILDATLTFDEHGHHKPTYKHNKASQKSGPYQLDRSHSAQSSISSRSDMFEGLTFSDAFLDSRFAGVSQIQDQRLTKSEAASPLPDGLPTGTLAGMPAALAPIHTNIPDLWSQPWGSASTQPDSLFSSAEDQNSAVSAGISPSGDFHHYSWNLFGPRASFDSSYNFPDSVPALTSGEVSENEADDSFISPSVETNPFATLSRTNTGSSIFSLNHTADFSTGDMGDMGDSAKYLESPLTRTMDQSDSLYASAAPPLPGTFDEAFAQWLGTTLESQANVPQAMWDQQF